MAGAKASAPSCANTSLEYEEKDIIKNPAFRWEMEQRSGQSLSPCVEIDGHMLPDISGEEVEKWMLENGYLQANDAAPDAPINSSCTDEQHEAMALGRAAGARENPVSRLKPAPQIRFFRQKPRARGIIPPNDGISRKRMEAVAGRKRPAAAAFCPRLEQFPP